MSTPIPEDAHLSQEPKPILSDTAIMSEPTVSAEEKRLTVLSLIYDFFILGIIIINLTMLGLDYVLMGSVGASLADWFGWANELNTYRTQWHGYIAPIDQWTTLLLMAELTLRWGVAIYRQQYHRWFFFPFAHWYETLGCIPAFRALRLLRVVVIGYKLYQLGINLIPRSLIRSGKFYYNLILEELSDRIIVHVLDSAERELKSSTVPAALIGALIDKNRSLFGQAITEIIQSSVSPALLAHEQDIKAGIGACVQTALNNTPELGGLIRLVPFIGKRVDHIAHSLGANVASEVIAALSSNREFVNVLATQVSQIKLDSPALNSLVESVVFESIDLLRKQVAIQQWKAEEAFKHP